jgi:uncharacterized repeat protein (TIGR03803 family)
VPFTKFTQSLVFILLGIVSAPSSWAQTYTVLYSFTGQADGAFPYSGVIRDSAGNLYGTSSGQGEGGFYGSVFMLTPTGKFNLLHSFGADETEGAVPMTGLALDSAGNLYGTTSCGGSSDFGTVFKVDTNDNFSVLYSFPDPWGSPGCNGGPFPGSLTLDSAGNLYGAGGGGKFKCNGGLYCGAVFKLDPGGNETTLHAFGSGKDGFYPNLGLIRDAAGNLFGTTLGGGHGVGVVFKLDSAENETVLHSFQRKDGAAPSPMVQDAAGNFYGTASGGQKSKNCRYGASRSCGLIFKIEPNGNETTFYSFTGATDGEIPYGGLLIDGAGNLYGTAAGGQPGVGYGIFFKIDPSGKETVLYNFAAGQAGFVTAMDSAGNFYGSAPTGGNLNDCTSDGGYGCGVVFEIAP